MGIDRGQKPNQPVKPILKKVTLCLNDGKWLNTDFYGPIRADLIYFSTKPTMGFPVEWFLTAVKFDQLVKCTLKPLINIKTPYTAL